MSAREDNPKTPQPSAFDPGSPASGEPVFLAVGRLRRPHGLRGDLLMEVLTDFPERLQVEGTVWVGEDRRAMIIRQLRRHGKHFLIAFQGIRNREAAGELRNQWVSVRADDRPKLPEGEYYHHQLLGLQVRDEEGGHLGSVDEILVTGANDVLVVRSTTRGELLLPMIDAVVLEVDLARGWMRVHLLPGLA